jgi:hypothetical protein
MEIWSVFLVWVKRLYFLTDASVIMERGGTKWEGRLGKRR